MFNLILHIGTHKTGTSSIQEILRQNEKLIKTKYQYSLIKIYDFNNLKEPCDFERLSEVIQKNKKNYIVSCERFSGDLYKGYTNVGSIFGSFNKLNQDYNIKVVAFYREQISFIESAYTQYIHEGGHNDICEFLTNFNIEGIKYTQHIAEIRRSLPNAELVISKYNPKGVLAEFFDICGFELAIDKVKAYKNSSYNLDALTFASQVNQYLTPEEKSKLRSIMQPLLCKTANDKRNILTSEKSMELREYFFNDNQLLRKDYGVDFGDQYKHVDGIIDLDAIAVLTKLLLNSHQNEKNALPLYKTLQISFISFAKKMKSILFR